MAEPKPLTNDEFTKQLLHWRKMAEIGDVSNCLDARFVETILALKKRVAESHDFEKKLIDQIAGNNTRIFALEGALEENGISVESLADYAHNAWAGWMKHLFRLSTENFDGSVTIPPHLVSRWKYQAETRYKNLPETMKPSDRKEANEILKIIARTARAGGSKK